MRFRLFTLLLLTIITAFSQYAIAQEVTIKRSTIVENFKGKPYYIHFVGKGETISQLAEVYNISIQELIAENPTVEKGVKADMVLRIPQKPIVSTAIVEVPNPVAKNQQPIPAEKPKVQTKPAEKQTEPNKPVEKSTVTGKSGVNQDYVIYTVKKHETLYGIAKMFNMTVDDVLNANPGFQKLDEGMEIKIPQKKAVNVKSVATEAAAVKSLKQDDSIPYEIIIKPGETLLSISKKYNISTYDLTELNPKLSDGLKTGMVLKLHKPDSKNTLNPTINTDEVPDAGPVSTVKFYSDDNMKVTYNIALLLPFLLDNSQDAIDAPEQKKASDFENFNYFQFYEGFMLAADSLQQYGLHARIQVLDGDKLNDTLTIRQTLRKPGMDKMDLIVGPVYANSFVVAARFASKNQIGIINPLSRRESIVDGNPYVLKAQVSGSGIASKLSSFILKQYPNANIISVRNDAKELKSIADDFNSQIRTCISGHTFKGTLQSATYATEMMAGVSRKLKPNVKNIIIFFSDNKSNVPNFVSLLNPLSKSNDIILIGMDGWDEFELETEFLVNLNYHQVTTSFVDYESETVQQFVTRFRNKYGAVPLVSKHAFLGYDIGLYFLTSLMWYGDHYMNCLPDLKGNGLQYNFNFSVADKANGMQNQDATIVKLQDYKMVKVE
jgi:LysM repeat protein/ABC-type branched-subunit amino acid transport system substrate-binding protein